ncbi:MAG TPA: ABC transporter substrate-binding protein, partial [Azonexus sp.]|nr:ABC transporter substrate-binding protein [Azonexus sp.]
MKTDRRLWLKALAAMPMGLALPALADGLETLRERGRLRIAVYNDFPPYSMRGGKGIDADIGRAIAAKLGLAAEIVGFNADEDMNDDLRNMVWKGHYLGTQPADLMLHVPVDEVLARANDKVRIFGAYHRETLALARNPERIRALSGSAAVALEIFTREKIGVETASLADSFLLSALNGRLRENVVHFRTVAEAGKALAEGTVAAVLAPRAELEAAIKGKERIALDSAKFAELKVDSWPLGMAVKVEEQALAEAVG